MSGPDARLFELSELASEIISSYELPTDSHIKNKQIVPVEGLGGHDILPYRIHGDKLILSVPNKDAQEGMKMVEGEIYAIETYASTGAGVLSQSESAYECSHFMLNPDTKSKRFFKKSDAYKGIKYRNGLPFTLQWCDKSHSKFVRDFKQAIISGDIFAYPPLQDEPHAKISQYEHTIRVRDGGVTIYSKGDDY
jgi:methionyl aminopeptidase